MNRYRVALFLATVTVYCGCNYADLRNTFMKSPQTTDSRAYGKQLLLKTAQRHGLQHWSSFQTKEFVAVDEWITENRSWWPSNPQRFRMQTILNTFSSRVELLDGNARGEIWGIQSWAPFLKKANASEPAFLKAPSRSIEFYLPTLQYFDEFPFRILSAPLVSFAGEKTLNDRKYRLVFATWGSWEPNPDHDQYLIWIHQETGLIDMVHYTLRDAVKWADPPMKNVLKVMAVGTIHFRNYRQLQGIWVPFEHIITLGSPRNARRPIERNFYHRLTVQDVTYDSVSRDKIILDPSRKESGDKKPS